MTELVHTLVCHNQSITTRLYSMIPAASKDNITVGAESICQ